jgi:hypothetical protein
MRWLNSIFSRKKNMEIKEKTLEEIKSDLSEKTFLWIKGESMGSSEKYKDVEIDESTGMTYVLFRSGKRINLDILEEYMEQYSIPIPDDIIPISSPAILPNNYLIEEQETRKNHVSSAKAEIKESPIYTLLKKQKSNWVEVSLNLKINLPTKNLYQVLVSSFEDADSEIIDYVTEGIDMEDVRSALAESIAAYYEKKKTTKNIAEQNESTQNSV